MTTHVIAKDGTKLMPTTNVKKVRNLLRSKRAVICKYDPFTIQLQYESTKNVQDIEFKEDAGYQHIGVSLTSQKHEYVSEQRDMLKDEVEHHKACAKYRRARRNRRRYKLRPGDIVLFDNVCCRVISTVHYGQYVKVSNVINAVPVGKVKLIRHANGWIVN
jgi:hypothetical protein